MLVIYIPDREINDHPISERLTKRRTGNSSLECLSTWRRTSHSDLYFQMSVIYDIE